MSLSKISRTDFQNWEAYYRRYQYLLADQYYIPLLTRQGIRLADQKILDVGCGDGGFISAFADRGAACTGVEMREFPWSPSSKVNFRVGDITTDNTLNLIGDNFDLVILRDVIEHIPLNLKLKFLLSLKGYMQADAKILLTFPPFYSPYGLHQQTILKSGLRWFPFLAWLPRSILKVFLQIAGENPTTLKRLTEIKDCRMTIHRFLRLLESAGFTIKYEHFFTVRPSHEIRYGLRMRNTLVGKIPLLREIGVTGTIYLLETTGAGSPGINESVTKSCTPPN